MASKMFSSRLPEATLSAIEARAARQNESKSEALAGLVADALDMRGRDGLESRIAALEAVVAEQARLLEKDGKRTPRVKRLSVGLTLAEAAEVEKAAHAAGMNRADYLRERILGRGPHAPRTLPVGRTQPALPGGGSGSGARQQRQRRPALKSGGR